MAMETSTTTQLMDIAARIAEMRQISGFSVAEMAEKTEVSIDQYRSYEAGKVDFPFTFIHKCALAFNLGITDLLEGQSARLSNFTVTRKGQGVTTADEDGIKIQNMAALFKQRLADPYYVTYQYSESLQSQPIHTTTHKGHEFDLVLSGTLRVKVGDHEEVLREGDSIYYKSSTPHGMIAIGGKDCTFLAMSRKGEAGDEPATAYCPPSAPDSGIPLLCEDFIHATEDEHGALQKLEFVNDDSYNFAFDTVDRLARTYPDKLAMLHIDSNMTERRFTFRDLKLASARAANYFKSLGIQRGDRVMVVLRRHYQFWFSMLGLHKLGAIAIPATDQLQAHDYVYRFQTAGVNAIVATSYGHAAAEIEKAEAKYDGLAVKILVGGSRENWHDFDAEFGLYSDHFDRQPDSPAGNDPMVMFFSSGTSGYPKIAAHSYKYALGHFVTAKYWHQVQRDGIHLTISDTGWGKALWGKLYGQWLCEGAVFVYDFERFDANVILPMFAKYNITTFCAPPTMYRMMIKQDLSHFDLSSVKHATTAGEALNPAVFEQFYKATGLQIMEGFGQTETTLTVGTLIGTKPRLGSMGKPVCSWDIDILDSDGNSCPVGENGEIVVRTADRRPNGLFLGYYHDEARTGEVWHDGYYHTGDVAWRDEDGYFWYVGRADDVIKSSGYRIGPFEIESVIMELPYVLECGISAAPDEIRGQVVKASIVLTKGTEGTEALKKEIQNYVKQRTAPYKYPRIVVFKDELPKTISGKIQRNKL